MNIFLKCLLTLFTVVSSARADGVQEHRITIVNEPVRLAGSLITPALPNGIGVVMLPGSGPAERRTMRPAAMQLAFAGMTVLIFDKRGSGESGGDWTTASLDDLAGDAAAAMSVLRGRDDVTRVGLWGHSQGNWVATRAAELGAKPAFQIAVAGGGASPQAVERYGYRHRYAGLASADQSAAAALVDAYFDYLAGKLPRDRLDALIAGARETSWYAGLGISRVLVSDTYRPQWQWVADYDPADSAGHRDYPTLVMLGGADHSIPLTDTIAAWNRQLLQSSVSGHRIEVLVGRGHHLRRSGAGHGHGVSTDREVWNIIIRWLEDQLLPSAVPSADSAING